MGNLEKTVEQNLQEVRDDLEWLREEELMVIQEGNDSLLTNIRSNINFRLTFQQECEDEIKFRRLIKRLRYGGVEDVGQHLLEMGYQPLCSTDVSGALSYGYGSLDEYGFWEFPVYQTNPCPREGS